jgi:tetratricopeptide (TPR) repeat protein
MRLVALLLTTVLIVLLVCCSWCQSIQTESGNAVNDIAFIKLERRHEDLLSEYATYKDVRSMFKLGQFYRYDYTCADPSTISPSVRGVRDHRSNRYCHPKAIELYLEARNAAVSGNAGSAGSAGSAGRMLLQADYLGMLNDLGLMLSDHNELDAAAAIMYEALDIDPTMFNVLINLATVENNRGNTEATQLLFEKALSIQASPALYHNIGVVAQGNQQTEYAVTLWEEAVRLDPAGMYASRTNLANDQCNKGHLEKSQAMFDSAAKHASDHNDVQSYWSIQLQKAAGLIHPIIRDGNIIEDLRDKYVDAMKRVLDKAPRDIIATPLHAIGCGCLGYYIIYHGFEDLYLRQLQARVVYKMSASVLAYASPLLLASTQPPYESLVGVGGTLSADISSPKRVKVGFLSAFFYHHSVGLLMQGVIKGIDRSIFDVYLIFVSSRQVLTVNDTVTQSLLGSVDSNNVLVCSGSIQYHQQQIAALGLDVLVFTELGMDHMSYMLAFARLAHRSVVFWGHALSSGITSAENLDVYNISGLTTHDDEDRRGGPDYFISSVLFEGNTEPEYVDDLSFDELMRRSSGTTASSPAAQDRRRLQHAQLQYSERLLLMNSLTTSFEKPAKPLNCSEFVALGVNRTTPLVCGDSARTGRNLLDIPSKRQYLVYLNESFDQILPREEALFRVYAVPQTLYKLHPGVDTLLIQILLQDAGAFIVFPTGENKEWMQLIIDRFIRSLNAAIINGHSGGNMSIQALLSRLLFVRRMNSREFLTMCAVADVVLDPFPVGGGRSSLEIFSTGTPIVLLQPNTTILQLTYGMYVTMGLGRTRRCCVAYSVDEYVRMAIHVASNYSFNQELRANILSRGTGMSLLYDNKNVVREWEKALLYITTAPRPVPTYTPLQAIPEEFFGLDSERRAAFANWRTNELEAIRFPHVQPPVFLGDIVCDHAHKRCVQTKGSQDNSPLATHEDNHRNEPDLTQFSLPLFVGGFSEKTRDGRDLSVSININGYKHSSSTSSLPPRMETVDIRLSRQSQVEVLSNWSSECLYQARDVGGMDDKLKLLFLCSTVGRAVRRLTRPVIPLRVPGSGATITAKDRLELEWDVTVNDMLSYYASQTREVIQKIQRISRNQLFSNLGDPVPSSQLIPFNVVISLRQGDDLGSVSFIQ